MSAFTKDYGEIVDTIITECDIFPAVDYTKPLPIPFHVTYAMWDTGADVCVISKKVIKALGLKPVDTAMVKGIHGEEEDNEYIVHVKLPTKDLVVNVQATEARSEEYDFVIGTNIICFGDFAFTNAEGKSVFSFRIPSEGHINFEK